jgi:hypothetical protein
MFCSGFGETNIVFIQNRILYIMGRGGNFFMLAEYGHVREIRTSPCGDRLIIVMFELVLVYNVGRAVCNA